MQDLIKKKFLENNIDIKKLNHNLTAYNKDNTKAIVIYDDCLLFANYYIICLKKNKEEWEIVGFEPEKKIDDLLYLINEVNFFLNY